MSRPATILVLTMGSLLAGAGADWQATVALPQAGAPGDRKGITNAIGMKLVPIPPGKFRMGSPASEKERDSDESRHEVAITRLFLMGVYEVTQEQYERMMGANPSYFTPEGGAGRSRASGPDHPVEQVLWREAAAFCSKLSELPEERQAGREYRLPTEAEWEYACRAGTGTVFHYGDTLSSRQANFNGSFPYGGGIKGPYLGRTAPVGSYPPNAFGLHDMHGNVQEWCADWYDPECYRSSPREDPKGPEQGALRTGFGDDCFLVVRGGSWLDEARGCRAAYRFRFMPSDRYRLAGFRVVCSVR